MKKLNYIKLKWFYAFILSIFLFASCDPLKILGVTGSSAQYSLIPTEGLSVSHIPNEDFFYINLFAAYYTGAGFDPLDAHIYSMDDGYDTDCKIPVEQESTEDLYCILDVMEGDLWYHKIVLEYNMPSGMCDYFSFDVPWHFNQKVGRGPAAVYACDNYTGTATCDGDNFPESETKYCLGGCTQQTITCGTSDPQAVTTACGEGTARAEAKDFCADLDKSEIELSNCCMGEYTLHDTDGEVTSSDVSWGGDLKQCIGGSARINWNYFNNAGRPITVIESALKNGVRKTYEMPNLISVYDGAKNTSENPSFITANYWTDVEDKESATNKPKFYVAPTESQLISYLRAYDGSSGYPYFTWSCLDKAEEVKHRIHLVIREWNTQEEFNTFKETEGGRGDPDGVGLEGSSCDYYDSSEKNILKDTNCNDMWDADDREAVSPGTGVSYNPYPEIIYKGSN